MIEEKFALLRTHRNNMARYRRLLKTKLTDCERQFIERRLSEERSAMEKLAASRVSNSGQVDRDTRTRDHMRPWQSGCRTNSRFLKWFWRRAAEKDGGGACPQQMGAPSCSAQNAIGLLPNIVLTGRSFSCSWPRHIWMPPP